MRALQDDIEGAVTKTARTLSPNAVLATACNVAATATETLAFAIDVVPPILAREAEALRNLARDGALKKAAVPLAVAATTLEVASGVQNRDGAKIAGSFGWLLGGYVLERWAGAELLALLGMGTGPVGMAVTAVLTLATCAVAQEVARACLADGINRLFGWNGKKAAQDETAGISLMQAEGNGQQGLMLADTYPVVANNHALPDSSVQAMKNLAANLAAANRLLHPEQTITAAGKNLLAKTGHRKRDGLKADVYFNNAEDRDGHIPPYLKLCSRQGSIVPVRTASFRNKAYLQEIQTLQQACAM